MSDRSDEITKDRQERSTDDLLEETERLLSEQPSAAERPVADTDTGTDANADTDNSADTNTSWFNRRRSSSESTATDTQSDENAAYFAPKAFLALVLAFGAAMLVGTTVVPIVSLLGGAFGLFGTAFLTGLVTSRRRYLEVATAGIGVGAVMTLLSSPLAAFLTSPTTFAAFGAGVGLLTGVLGYYFGRDLRDGLAREV